MQDTLEDIKQYVRGIWLKRRYIVIASWIICPLGWAYVTSLPNEYTSSARVYADTRSILQPLLRGLAIQTDPSQELQLMVKTLLSRGNLEKIARDTDADVRADNPEEYEAILDDLKANITIRSTGRENLYTISYDGADAVFVRDVVQSALNVFVESALGEKRLDSDQANEFIARQIKEYEGRLIDAEKKLATFKRDYTGFLPGSERSLTVRLDQTKGLLENALLALDEAHTRVVSVKTQISQEEETAAGQLGQIETEYDTRIDNLADRLDELRFRYTEKHPDVIETRRQLGQLRYLKKRELASVRDPADSLQNNSVYESLKITLADLENEVASLEIRVQNYQQKISTLGEKIKKVPDVEAQLVNMTRNYEITKNKYEELLERRESALIAKSAGVANDDIKFRIIDPPLVPLKPSGPFRLLLLTAVLFVGLGTGVAMSLLISQISPIVTSTRQLYQLTGLPVFGVVSATPSSRLQQWEKRKMRYFLIMNILLIGFYFTIVVMSSSTTLHGQLLKGFVGL